jgi:hypothetical protein
MIRGLGFGALGSIILAFIFWLGSWIYWTFLSVRFGFESPLKYVAQTFGVLGVLLEMLAVLLVAVGLIIASKHFSKP